jgi:hypothetical protein
MNFTVTAPAHVLPIACGPRGGRVLTPGRWARLGARVRRAALDRALASGADPAASPLLAARVCALTAPAARLELADALELALRSARRPPSRRRLAPLRATVEANAAMLSELAWLLRDRVPLYARGLAMLATLVSDGTGPLYARGDGAALASALGDARAALFG